MDRLRKLSVAAISLAAVFTGVGGVQAAKKNGAMCANRTATIVSAASVIYGTEFNDVVYYIASYMVFREPESWRWSHARHHSDTIIVGIIQVLTCWLLIGWVWSIINGWTIYKNSK